LILYQQILNNCAKYKEIPYKILIILKFIISVKRRLLLMLALSGVKNVAKPLPASSARLSSPDWNCLTLSSKRVVNLNYAGFPVSGIFNDGKCYEAVGNLNGFKPNKRVVKWSEV